jgi:dihydroflavonol-4-reductase
VLVTGGSGYLAGWMIRGLLAEGCRVRATVRSMASAPALLAAIAARGDAADRVTFHAANLLSDAGWDAAAEGCDFAIHVASPMGQGQPRGTDLVGPARDGSLRVLRAAARAGVRRVVATSSTMAAMPPGHARTPIDESMWTDPAARGVGEYQRSKTLAERAAWEFMRAAGGAMTLATVLPGLILGPVLDREVSGSVEVVARLLTGGVPAVPRIGFNIVDVRDLVDLHLLAMRATAAAGERFIATNDFLWMSEIAALLRDELGARASRVPRRALPDIVVRVAALFQEEARFMAPMLGRRSEFDIGRSARLLGWRPRPSRQAVLDCARSLLQAGLA